MAKAGDVKEFIDWYYLGLGNVTKIKTRDVFLDIFKDSFYRSNPHLAYIELLKKPEYFGYTAKKIMNLDLLPFQTAILHEMFVRPFPMLIACRGASKTFNLAVYSMLHALLIPGTKIIISGAGFRQSKMVFAYMETIYNNAPILKEIISSSDNGGFRRALDHISLTIGDSTITGIPIGDGSKIRGYRGNVVILDEFASINIHVVENAIHAFGSVSQNPSEAYQKWARAKALAEMGVVDTEPETTDAPNKIIISGTPSFEFEDFYKYWSIQKKIIESKGDKKLLKEVFNGEIPPGFDWRNYSIIRLPVECVPPKFMDEQNVANAKAKLNRGLYLKEYAAVFPKDSTGFFKRSLISQCVVNEDNPNFFDAMIRGNSNRRYVMGIDPASERDNLAITIVEVNPDHRRIVYCWTINRPTFMSDKENQKKDYYAYCAKKIRELMGQFNCVRLAMDSQGGGVALEEALKDEAKMEQGDLPILPIINPDKPRPTDDMPGLHILELVSFADSNWLSFANHSMKKDFEDQVLLFPRFDSISLELAYYDDQNKRKSADSYEDCIENIEELKSELQIVTYSITPSGRERWDVPDIKLDSGKKGKAKKDRYSALLMANAAARMLDKQPSDYMPYKATGGYKGEEGSHRGQMYSGPNWIQNHEFNYY